MAFMFNDAVVCYFLGYLLSFLFMVFEKKHIQYCLKVKKLFPAAEVRL